MLYLAGVYNRYGDRDHFVILTTQPNESVRGIHNRMPLILEHGQVRDWILDGEKTGHLLRQTPGELERTADYEQQTLKFE